MIWIQETEANDQPIKDRGLWVYPKCVEETKAGSKDGVWYTKRRGDILKCIKHSKVKFPYKIK